MKVVDLVQYYIPTYVMVNYAYLFKSVFSQFIVFIIICKNVNKNIKLYYTPIVLA